MLTAMIVSALLSQAQAQTETPAKGGPPPVEAPAGAGEKGKVPGMMPMPPGATDTKIKGDECNAEAKSAKCTDTAIGMPLLSCMMKYKKDHKEFSVSPVCRAAIQKWHMNQKSH